MIFQTVLTAIINATLPLSRYLEHDPFYCVFSSIVYNMKTIELPLGPSALACPSVPTP